MNGRFPLNPCDRLVYGHHLLQTRRSPEGNTAYMITDVDGVIEPDALRDALARTLARHPATIGSLRITFPAGLPFWKFPSDIAVAARTAAKESHSFVDLRNSAKWQSLANRLHPTDDIRPWNHRSGPQVRLEQFALPGNRTRIFLRWPHFFMDAEGALAFLAQLGRPDALQKRDAGPIEVLRASTWTERIGLARRGFARSPAEAGLNFETLSQGSNSDRSRPEVLHRFFTADETEQIQVGARRWAPAGPARYARFLAAGVLRAVHQFLAENGITADACCITMPLRVGISDSDSRQLDNRPIPGNYLVTPLLCGRVDRLADRRAIGDDILAQFQDFIGRRLDLAQWALMQAASYLHAWAYPLIFKLPLGMPALASGFSYYGEIREPFRTLCGMRVLNCWGGGPIATPPGLNPVFSRFENRLNLALTYDQAEVTDQMARRYLQLIEREILESGAGDAFSPREVDVIET